MSLMSWNYQGLRNLRSVKVLEKAINKEEPTIIFLMEMKSNREWMNNVKDKCNMKYGLTVPSEGRSSELALMWKEGIIVEVQTYSQSHIDDFVDGRADIRWWHFTSFYHNLDIAKRTESWAKLRHLKRTLAFPWLTIGDFNEITNVSEKGGGGSEGLRQQMKNFIDTINYCGL